MYRLLITSDETAIVVRPLRELRSAPRSSRVDDHVLSRSAVSRNWPELRARVPIRVGADKPGPEFARDGEILPCESSVRPPSRVSIFALSARRPWLEFLERARRKTTYVRKRHFRDEEERGRISARTRTLIHSRRVTKGRVSAIHPARDDSPRALRAKRDLRPGVAARADPSRAASSLESLLARNWTAFEGRQGNLEFSAVSRNAGVISRQNKLSFLSPPSLFISLPPPALSLSTIPSSCSVLLRFILFY